MKFTSLLAVALSISAVLSGSIPKKYQVQQYLDNPAVQKFQEYVRIDTSREENIECAVEFWRRQAVELGLPFAVYRPAGKPICVLTVPGADPSLPSIMLNSHMDVVTVEEEDWKYPPFSAYIDENGDMFGRGTQDTKDVAIQYIEAIARLNNDNIILQRTLHLTLMPDEESGGLNGMMSFLDTEEFKALNVGFALDEGVSSMDDTLLALYLDKRPWQMKITVKGAGGHSAGMPDNSAMEKMQKLIDAIGNYRESQKSIRDLRDATDFGAYTSLNINILNGGVATNVIASKMSLVLDMRLSASADVNETQDLVNSWLAETGNGTELNFLRRIDSSSATPIDESNKFWVAMQDAITEMGMRVKPILCPAVSDMIYLRSRGIPALGFAPKTNTMSRIHGTNEYSNIPTFLRGIDIYVGILKRLGNV